jgi:HSP20 family molecular chaperone IbpA
MMERIMSDTTEVVQKEQQPVARGEREPAEQRATLTPPVDVIENAHGVTLWADLPGVAKEKLEVRVHDGNLHIEAEASVPTRAGLRLQHAEIRAPHFSRSFTLGAEFDTSKIEANLQDGVLKLVIPRREEARPRRIEVNVG